MKQGNYILIAILLMGMASVSMASDKSDKANKSDKTSALQKATKDAAKDIGTGANNLVNAIKEMPGAIGKATKKIEHNNKGK